MKPPKSRPAFVARFAVSPLDRNRSPPSEERSWLVERRRLVFPGLDPDFGAEAAYRESDLRKSESADRALPDPDDPAPPAEDASVAALATAWPRGEAPDAEAPDA
jgi:hypothetical protein